MIEWTRETRIMRWTEDQWRGWLFYRINTLQSLHKGKLFATWPGADRQEFNKTYGVLLDLFTTLEEFNLRIKPVE